MRHLLSVLLGLRCAASPFALEVTVVDEAGDPVSGSGISCETVPRLALDPWNAPARRLRIEAVADAVGRSRLVGEHALPELVVGAVAPGFYPAARRVARTEGRVRLVLPRRLGAARCVQLEILTAALPDDGAEHGFDLALGAFVAPLGVGARADVWLRGRCPSARLPRGAPGAYVDEAVMRFADPEAGVVAVPRPGQEGFAASVAPACEGMILPGLSGSRVAPDAGYVPVLAYRAARGPAPDDLPGPGRVGAPQWIIRVRREAGWLHGLVTDFGWTEDGRLRLAYRLSLEPGNRSLELGP